MIGKGEAGASVEDTRARGPEDLRSRGRVGTASRHSKSGRVECRPKPRLSCDVLRSKCQQLTTPDEATLWFTVNQENLQGRVIAVPNRRRGQSPMLTGSCINCPNALM
jgi:hypothetical protein